MKNKISYFITMAALIFYSAVNAQVSINTDGSTPDTNAMLEIKSDNKGLLLPRLDWNNRPATPVAGLLIYVTENSPLGSGLYMGNGYGWVKLAATNYTIGGLMGGGVVYYVDETGLHGLIAAQNDHGYSQWGCDSVLIGPEAQHFGLMEGDLNTAAILANCPQTNTAAYMCDTLTLNGYTDWYLPSINELDSMLSMKNIIGGFQDYGWYWSSTESDSIWAFFSYNDSTYSPYWSTRKNYEWVNVRCVRKF
jgi:hypothetical protein